MTLRELEESVRKCRRCPLWKSRRNAVPGEGAENAAVMLVGEAPGREEDARGRPFVGRAGKLLDELLHSAGIKRSDLYITSVLKCRPPGNRNPLREETKECLRWLHAQIELVRPRVVGLMGNTAIKSLVGKTGISGFHGRTVENEGRKFLLLHHPAAGIYNANLIPQMKEDYKKLAEFL